MDKEFLDHDGLQRVVKNCDLSYSSSTEKRLIIPASWNNKKITISDEFFSTSDRYVYFIGPSEDSKIDYGNCGIYMKQISETGKATFVCDAEPREVIEVDIFRVSMWR